VDDEQTGATIARERALLLEALTLLVQRQAEAETTLTGQVAQTNSRVAQVERRGLDLEARLTDIDARLQHLATQVEPDPELARRVAMLQAQVERLHGAAADERAAPQATAPAPQPVAPAPQPLRQAPPPQPPPTRQPVPVEPIRQPRTAPAPRRAALVGSGDSLWELLGATNQDRASIVLIGAGLVAVVFAALAQLR
jgi:hypothetical protein